MGIDPGTRRTGWGVVDATGSRMRRLDSGVLHGRSDALAPRLHAIGDGLDGLLRTWQPEAVAVERVFQAKNTDSALKLGHARGVVLLCAVRATAEVFEYTAAEIKQATVGTGRADKEQVRHMVCLVLGHAEALALDESDALAAAICHLQRAPARSKLAALISARRPDSRFRS